MIPYKAHYVWFGPYPDNCPFVDEWARCVPEVIRWTNENYQLRKYLSEAVEMFGRDSLSSKSITYVSDLVRLLILRDHGGIYLDHDFILLKSLDSLLVDVDFATTFQFSNFDANQAISFQRGKNLKEVIETDYHSFKFETSTVNNCFIACKPNSEFILRCIDVTIDNHNRPKEEQFAMSDWGVGPAVFTQVASEYGFNVMLDSTQRIGSTIIFDSSKVHPVHGRQRYQFGDEKFSQLVAQAMQNTDTFAIHMHVHFGATGFISGAHKTFLEWYDEYNSQSHP